MYRGRRDAGVRPTRPRNCDIIELCRRRLLRTRDVHMCRTKLTSRNLIIDTADLVTGTPPAPAPAPDGRRGARYELLIRTVH